MRPPTTPTKYVFTMIRSDGSTLTYECELGRVSWRELIEEFTYFLRGCGFQLDGEFEFVPQEEACREAEWAAKIEQEEFKHEDSESVGLENTVGLGEKL